jgi:hypothetical protein
VRLERLGKLKKFNDLIRTRTHDLLACIHRSVHHNAQEKIYPWERMKDLHSGTCCVEADVLMEKDHFMCQGV